MSKRIALAHTLTARFERRVNLSTHWLRLRPAPHTKPEVSAYSLRIDTEPHFINWVRDPFENYLARVDLPEPVFRFGLCMELIADLEPLNPFDFLVDGSALEFPFEYDEQLLKELKPYLHLPKPGPHLAGWLEKLTPEKGYIVEKLGAINDFVHRSLVIGGDASPCAVDPERVLSRGSASPWEAAWLLTLAFRRLGLAARFTSGYRIFLTAAPALVHAFAGEEMPEALAQLPDSAALHAWSEVYIPGAGWIGLDPSGGIYVNESHIPLASAPDPLRTRPWLGYHEACEAEWSETVRVRRLLPEPAPAPYTEGQWSDLKALGEKVDGLLADRDLSLATGTSVCLVAGGSGAPEWSTLALGPDKRAAADDLLARLWRRLAPGGVVLESQGEWFAGETLPRWKLGCYYRADGRPIWRNPSVLGQFAAGSDTSAADAEYFGQTLARKLGIAPSFLMPAYEDQLHELWMNRAQIHCEPPSEALSDPLKRLALAKSLSESSQEPSGYVLPLRWDAAGGNWQSGIWQFRRGRLYLVPGKSPLGYRLPLDSLPVGAQALESPDPDRCPFEERPLLPAVYGELSARLTSYSHVPALESADSDEPPPRAPRTALCLEIRHGRLRLFLPPLTHLEHFLDLIVAIEATAFGTGIPVALEGYEPPEDYRLRRLMLEPDAGVLRVSLPSADGFGELTEGLDAVYQEAAALGLLAERIAEDGTRQPPGGSADLRLGGERPVDSPFLKRPSLLHSLIAFWQNHPSLSYLFAGRLVGPSGPAPRPDEGRDDALYELGIALARLPEGETPYPWLPDRALRHLLADPAGDMKRAEICIDELYGPDRSAQRLGRISVRAFETAPNAKLAAAQALLVRALIAGFAQKSADYRLTEFGPALHDRFMLPQVLWEDFEDVLRELHWAGLPMQASWYEPLLATRFPVVGRVDGGERRLELRMAHEPWPVLSEEVTSAGVTRFIDSANQRLQVSVAGMIPGLHALVCNGRRVPLQPTKVRGLWVGGVRYKAWNPVATLHPTLPAVGLLVFDLLDIRTGESICGCTYQPARPGFSGAMAIPPKIEDTDPGSRRGFRSHAIDLPPWAPGGRFVAKGSDQPVRPIPEERIGRDAPYLLDLTRLN